MSQPLELLRQGWNWVRSHKYLVACIVFILFLMFGENNIFVRIKHRIEIKQLEAEIAEFNAIYDDTAERLEELNNNPEAVEKIAREQYYMKSADEDVFIIDD